jgi:ZIP family zinc transporter
MAPEAAPGASPAINPGPFAAGAMIFVVVEEVIPETQQDKNTDIATLGFIGGFIVMMVLDVALG